MEYPIYYRGTKTGTLTVTEDGLYRQLSGWTERFAEGVQRLYACYPEGSVCFGVFAPAGKGLSLHRRVSRHAVPDLPEQWAAGRAAEGFLPWRGTVEGQLIPDAMLRKQTDGALLAIPADRDPVPLAEYAPQMERITLDGREFFCLPLKDGVPEAPETDPAEGEVSAPVLTPAPDLPEVSVTEDPQGLVPAGDLPAEAPAPVEDPLPARA